MPHSKTTLKWPLTLAPLVTAPLCSDDWLRQCIERARVMVSNAELREFGQQHRLDLKTPLLSIARRLKCTHCNQRKAHCWPEPYGIEMKTQS
jgi:hypothetical protein